MILHAYLIPAVFLVILAYNRDDFLIKSLILGKGRGIKGPLLRRTPEICQGIKLCVLVWAAGVCVMALLWCCRAYRLRRLLQASAPEEDAGTLALFQEIQKRLGVKKNAVLLRNDMIRTPFVTGVRRHIVVLPFRSYTEKELCVILTHELSHCRQHDLLYKAEAIWASIIHIWNPCMYMVRKWMTELAECVCDIHACTHCDAQFTAKEYFSIILEEAVHDEKTSKYLMVALSDSKSGLERRIHNMKKYQRGGAVRRGLAAVIMAGFLLGGSVTAYAAGAETVDAQNQWYEATRVEIEVEAPAVTQYVLLPDEVEDIPSVLMDDGIQAYGGIQNINWNVPANMQYYAPGFSLSSGDTVNILASTSPEGYTVRVGLIYPDGSEHYMLCSGSASAPFVADQKGVYNFFVTNSNSISIQVSAAYSY